MAGSNLVPVARFYDYPAALVACSALNAAGIKSSLAEQCPASVAWHHIVALQGIRLLVSRTDVDTAKAVLHGVDRPAGQTHETPTPKPKLYELILAGLVLFKVGLPLPLWLRRK
ncbi:MAG: hypothetical protein AAGF14_00205 [Pseudomonadota bacterium]